MIRLRQVALVVHDLDAVVDSLCRHLGLRVCFRDPRVSAFGFRNALAMIGDQFLEVVSPGMTIAADDPITMHARWTQLGLAHSVHFVPAGLPGEGIDALDVVATDRARTGESLSLAGVTIRLV